MEYTAYTESIKAMIALNRLHKKVFENEVSKTGLHRTGHFILMQLSKDGGLPSQKELAALLGITPAAVTLALGKLEEDGLVARKAGQDTRFNEIEITESGREIVSRSREYFAKVDVCAFAGVLAEEKEIFDRVVSKLTDNLKDLVQQKN